MDKNGEVMSLQEMEKLNHSLCTQSSNNKHQIENLEKELERAEETLRAYEARNPKHQPEGDVMAKMGRFLYSRPLFDEKLKTLREALQAMNNALDKKETAYHSLHDGFVENLDKLDEATTGYKSCGFEPLKDVLEAHKDWYTE